MAAKKKQQPETERMKNCVQEHGKKDGQFMSAETWMSRSAVITNCYETVLLYMSESKKKDDWSALTITFKNHQRVNVFSSICVRVILSVSMIAGKVLNEFS